MHWVRLEPAGVEDFQAVVDVIRKVLARLEVQELFVRDLILDDPIRFGHFYDGMKLERTELATLLLAALRGNEIWCRVESVNLTIHFGWDYLVYIGSPSIVHELSAWLDVLPLKASTVAESPYEPPPPPGYIPLDTRGLDQLAGLCLQDGRLLVVKWAGNAPLSWYKVDSVENLKELTEGLRPRSILAAVQAQVLTSAPGSLIAAGGGFDLVYVDPLSEGSRSLRAIDSDSDSLVVSEPGRAWSVASSWFDDPSGLYFVLPDEDGEVRSRLRF